MNNQRILVAFAWLSIVLFSCSSEGEKSVAEQEEAMDKEIIQELSKEDEPSEAQKVFYTLPSPFEVSRLMKESGMKYDQTILNKVENLSNYTSTTSRALNFGIYGADVSITSIYNETQQTMLYLSCIKNLADELGITTAFDIDVMERLEMGKEKQDSLQTIVAQAYSIANSYLKENARSATSSLILVGGWIEGVHIATSMVDPEETNEELMELIADQRFSIENLIGLLNLNKGDAEIESVLADLEALDALFAQIDAEKDNDDVSASTNEDGKTVFGGSSVQTISPELLEKITAKVNEVRNKFVG